ncbi:nitroreductase family protein [Candidatus Woesearchaeota archaeon]|nr:nitroreductase family protein [Candidatus Woesearchaeota archaeon]
MELDQVIKERKSVRKFKSLNVPWYIISECLEAAIQAPSSGNVQNWRFIIIRNKETREKIAKICDEQYWMLKAPMLIVVCSEVTKIKRMFGARGEALYAVQNCSAAIQNMLLKAHELGLGTTWIGAFDETKLREILSIEEIARPQAVFAIGYPESYEEKSRREPLETVIFFEKYGQKEDKERGKIIPAADIIKKHITNIVEKHKK